MGASVGGSVVVWELPPSGFLVVVVGASPPLGAEVVAASVVTSMSAEVEASVESAAPVSEEDSCEADVVPSVALSAFPLSDDAVSVEAAVVPETALSLSDEVPDFPHEHNPHNTVSEARNAVIFLYLILISLSFRRFYRHI